MNKFYVPRDDDISRLTDIVRQMRKPCAIVGSAVVVKGLTEAEKLSILYMVRCEEQQVSEEDCKLL